MYSETNFQLDPTKDIEFPPYTHIVKNRPLWQRHVYRHDVAKVSDFTMGVYGEKFILLSDPTKIMFLNI